jgi:hypothetical protein
MTRRSNTLIGQLARIVTLGGFEGWEAQLRGGRSSIAIEGSSLRPWNAPTK